MDSGSFICQPIVAGFLRIDYTTRWSISATSKYSKHDDWIVAINALIHHATNYVWRPDYTMRWSDQVKGGTVTRLNSRHAASARPATVPHQSYPRAL
ncbi:hypothetical protein J6590_095071 [Homalodisca vitripennis]|nr:hypothetical protein J6590_095071 [Homalodisca vitripennis]